MVIVPERPVDVGPATIDIEFTGILNDKLRGFYRSTFVDDDGDEHVIATTQMQATDCRRAFPCWDEPEFKAVFAHHAGHRPGADGGVEQPGDRPPGPPGRQGGGDASATRW